LVWGLKIGHVSFVSDLLNPWDEEGDNQKLVERCVQDLQSVVQGLELDQVQSIVDEVCNVLADHAPVWTNGHRFDTRRLWSEIMVESCTLPKDPSWALEQMATNKTWKRAKRYANL
jgi:hypothetical protein